MSFTEGTQLLSDSAGTALGSAGSKMKVVPGLSFSVFTKLFHSMVGSVLFYSAGVGCKGIYLGLHKLTAKLALQAEMGWEPCLIKQRIEMMRLWNRLTQLPEDRLTTKVFLWDCSNQCPWAREMAKIFSDSDLNYICRNRLQCDLNLFHQKLLEEFKKQWKYNICQKQS